MRAERAKKCNFND